MVERETLGDARCHDSPVPRLYCCRMLNVREIGQQKRAACNPNGCSQKVVTPGTHYLVVIAWDNAGNYIKAAEYFTVK